MLAAMDRLLPVFEAFDMLDIVLAVFGAIVVSMWFGAGKTVWGILSGALMGGLVKPVLLMVFVGGAFIMAQDSPP